MALTAEKFFTIVTSDEPEMAELFSADVRLALELYASDKKFLKKCEHELKGRIKRVEANQLPAMNLFMIRLLELGLTRFVDRMDNYVDLRLELLAEIEAHEYGYERPKELEDDDDDIYENEDYEIAFQHAYDELEEELSYRELLASSNA